MEVFITMRANKPWMEENPPEYLNVADGDELYRAIDSARLPAEAFGEEDWRGESLPFKRYEY
jgi:hypothetical protein